MHKHFWALALVCLLAFGLVASVLFAVGSVQTAVASQDEQPLAASKQSTNPASVMQGIQSKGPNIPMSGGDWDGYRVDHPRVITDTGGYRMWYSGRNPENSGYGWLVGEASSPDGTSWTKFAGNPLFGLGATGAWDDMYRGQAAFLKEGGIYKMWFSGGSETIWQTGYATSTNGLAWSFYAGNPVLTPGPGGSWDEGESDGPSVIKDGSTYKMWYHGCNADYSACHIGYATSPDGTTWTKEPGNPVLDPGTGDEWDKDTILWPRVIKDGDTYWMWYFSNDAIGLATSTDGISWTKSLNNPVLKGWGDGPARGFDVILEGGFFKMWLRGGKGSSEGIGYATSHDGVNWDLYPDNPVLRPGLPGVSIEVNYAHDWVNAVTGPGMVVTMTVADSGGVIGTVSGQADDSGNFGSWQSAWNPGQPDLLPGDRITAETTVATTTVNPVGQIQAVVDPDANTVSGKIFADWFAPTPLNVRCEVWVKDGPGIDVPDVSPDGGDFTCDFSGKWDIEPGQDIAVRYFEPDGDNVINVFSAPWMRVNYSHDWVGGNYSAGHTFWITVTNDISETKATAEVQSVLSGGWGSEGFETKGEDWSPSQPDIRPGDWVQIAGDDGYHNTIHVGQISALVDANADSLSGNIFAGWFAPTPLNVRCEVWVKDGPGMDVPGVPPDGGDFSCDFASLGWDVQGGQDIAVQYYEPDGDRVIGVFSAPWMRVNYGHDWVGGDYPAGHTFWITVTQATGEVKATAVKQSESGGGWNGEGFETRGEDWSPSQPDIVPGDWVYFASEDGYHNTVHVGQITGDVDTSTDSVSGYVFADWFAQPLSVECHPWGGPKEASAQSSSAAPDGSSPYFCQWDPGEWDIIAGQDIGVMYIEPDGDRVINPQHAPAPRLGVKTWSDGSPAEGGNLDFYIEYWNEGEVSADDTHISAVLQGMHYLDDTAPPGPVMTSTLPGGDELVSWGIGSLPPDGNHLTFHLFAGVTVPASNTITSTVQISTSTVYDGSWDEGQRQSQWSGHVGSNDTHLNLGKWPWTGDPTPGQDFVWVVNPCNYGSTGSTELLLQDTLPISTTLVSWWAQHAGWVELYHDDHELQVQYPTLSNGRCSEVYLRVHMDGNTPMGVPLENTATITATNDIEGDDNTASNTVWVSAPHTNLWVDTRWNWGVLVPGGELRYNLNYGNNGNMPVGSTIRITDTLPVSTTFASAWTYDDAGPHPFPPSQVNGDTVVWELSELDNGFSGGIELVLNLDGGVLPGTELVNRAEISPQPAEDRYDDNSSQWVETVHEHGPNLRVRKEGDWRGGDGHNAWFNIIFENVGDVGVSHATVTDFLPDSMTLDGDPWTDWGSVEDWTRNDAEGWFSVTFNYAHPNFRRDIGFNTLIPGSDPLPYATVFTNTAEVMLVPGDTDLADNQGYAYLRTGPDLYVEKKLVAGDLLPGSLITFSLRFGNDQSGSAWWWQLAGTAWLTDTLPAGLEFVSAEQRFCGGSNWCTVDPNIVGNDLTWQLWPMKPSDWNEFYVTARIPDTADGRDSFTNWAEIASDNPGTDIEYDTGNNTASVSWDTPLPYFQVSKSYVSSRVAGMPIQYTLTLSNLGHRNGSNLDLIDWLPDWVTYVSGGSYNAGLITWDIASLLSGDTTQAAFNGTLACTAGGVVNNQFYRVSASDQGVSSADGAPVSFNILAPTLHASFTASGVQVYPGVVLNFNSTSTTNGTALSYAWSFGDGQTATGLAASHAYAHAGRYPVTLTVTDGCGFTDTETIYVTVWAKLYLPLVRK